MKYKKLVFRLNESINLAAERLRQVVETKNQMKHVIEENRRLEHQLHQIQQHNRQTKKEDSDHRLEQVKLMNRLVRAEALAASLEMQLLHVLRCDDSIDYTYKPDIAASPNLQAALAQSLILSADEIASDFNEEKLRQSVKTPSFTGDP